MRRFHEAPVDACPFRLTTEDAIATVRHRVADGRAEHADLREELSHLSLEKALTSPRATRA